MGQYHPYVEFLSQADPNTPIEDLAAEYRRWRSNTAGEA